MGRGWLDAVHPEDRGPAEATWRQAVEAMVPLETEFRLRHVSEGWRWTAVRAAPLRNPEGVVYAWVGMNTDITERKQAEEALRTLTTAVNTAGTQVTLEVADTGPGIPAELQHRVFEPFFTTRPQEGGSGLGLSLCRSVIEAHGGAIGLSSQVGQGTTVHITLLVAPPAEVQAPETPGEADASGPTRHGRILLIDDEAGVRRTLQRLLQRSGQDITLAANGHEGLAALETGAYDLILCDIRMPNLDGPGFYHELGRRYPHLLDGFAKRDAVLRLDLHLMARPQTQDEALLGQMIDRRCRHRNGGDAADKDTANTCPQHHAPGRYRTGRQDGELIAPMPLGHPGRFIPQFFGPLHTLHDLTRRQSAAKCHSDACHPCALFSGGNVLKPCCLLASLTSVDDADQAYYGIVGQAFQLSILTPRNRDLKMDMFLCYFSTFFLDIFGS